MFSSLSVSPGSTSKADVYIIDQQCRVIQDVFRVFNQLSKYYFNLVTTMYIRYYFYFCMYLLGNGLSTIYSYVYQITITSVDKACFGRLKLFSDHKIIAINIYNLKKCTCCERTYTVSKIRVARLAAYYILTYILCCDY